MKENFNIYFPPVLQTDWFTVEQLHTRALTYISCKIKSCKDTSARTSHKARWGKEKKSPNMYSLSYKTMRKKKAKLKRAKETKCKHKFLYTLCNIEWMSFWHSGIMGCQYSSEKKEISPELWQCCSLTSKLVTRSRFVVAQSNCLLGN